MRSADDVITSPQGPCGVGFSYSKVQSDLTNGDNQTAVDNLMALEHFFVKYPTLKTNPFYVSGESYGGVYVPTLSLKIYQAGAGFGGNMKGYLVGNGVFDDAEAASTTVPFLYVCAHDGLARPARPPHHTL